MQTVAEREFTKAEIDIVRVFGERGIEMVRLCVGTFDCMGE